jgi:UDP-N-acetyl-D-mannosaminuronic acid dehydrogenase
LRVVPAARERTVQRKVGFQPDVAIVGMGYVGITLAAALADAGLRVLGIERRSEVVDAVNSGRSPVYEPGLDEILSRASGTTLRAVSAWPGTLPDIVVICVSTPADPSTGTPDLSNLASASGEIARRLPAGGLVIVRSTVPVGTSRSMVLETIRSADPSAGLAFCPERTVQGAALMELRSLPQVVGAVDEASAVRAEALFGRLTGTMVRLGSLEAAEMVKLVNNCHTDLLYAFGNEIALLASTHGIDPLDVVRGANEGYTEQREGFAVVRPRIARPGFVGGGCLSKDPYLLLRSLGSRPPSDSLVACARSLNESMPERAALEVLDLIAGSGMDPSASALLVCGFAYKGVPETDDTRGTPASPFIAAIEGRVRRILGHDYRVPHGHIASMGAEPVELTTATLASVDAIALLNDHPRYAADLESLLPPGRRIVVYDSWRILMRTRLPAVEGVIYGGMGHV